MNSTIEFYERGAKHPFAHADSSMVPPVGALISIRGKTYKVERVTYALDQPAGDLPRMRANIDVAPHKSKAQDPQGEK